MARGYPSGGGHRRGRLMDNVEIRLNPTNGAEVVGAFTLAMLDRHMNRRISKTKFTWDDSAKPSEDGFTRQSSFSMCGDIVGFIEDLRSIKLELESTNEERAPRKARLATMAGGIDINFFESLNDRLSYSNLNLQSAGDKTPIDRIEKYVYVFQEVLRGSKLSLLFSVPVELPNFNYLSGYNMVGEKGRALYASDFFSMVGLCLLRHSFGKQIDVYPRPSKAIDGHVLELRYYLWRDWVSYPIALAFMTGNRPAGVGNWPITVMAKKHDQNNWFFK